MSQNTKAVFDLSESEEQEYSSNTLAEEVDYNSLPSIDAFAEKFPAFEKCTRSNTAFLVELPLSVSIQSKQYKSDKTMFEPDIEEVSKGNFKTNFATIRWRGTPENPQSNARVCKWSDGSYTLQIGADHIPLSSKGSQPQLPAYHLIPDPTLVGQEGNTAALPFTSANIQPVRLEMSHTQIDEKHKRTIDTYLASKQ